MLSTTLFTLLPLVLPQDLASEGQETASAPAVAMSQEEAAAPKVQEAHEVSHEERVKRAYVYTIGARYILQRTLDELLVDEIAWRMENNVPVGDVEISDEVLEAQIQERILAVKEQDPNLDFWKAVESQGFTPQSFRAEVRRNMQARNMFFPDDPEAWPVERLKTMLGDHWEQFMAKNHEDLLAHKKENAENLPINDQMLNQFLMPTVWRYMMDQSEIRYPSHGLPEGVALSINGRPVKTDDILAIIEPFLGDHDRRLAETFISKMEAAEKDLMAKGVWMAKADSDVLLDDEKSDYEGAIIPHEMMVVQFLGYPTLDIYEQLFRARKSFRATLPAEGTEEYRAMQEEIIKKRGSFYGGGKVKADVILISAQNIETGTFALEGDPFASAKERATEVAEILAGGQNFDDVLMEYSDYPDQVPNSQPGMPQPNRGKLPPQSRNDLRGFLGESDYSDFLQGYSISDDIFFLGEPGAIYGPIRGPLGYYFYRVESRTPATREMDIDGKENDAYIVNDDLLTTRFLQYVSGLSTGASD